MERLPMNGSSVYDRLVTIYSRRHDGYVVHCTNEALRANWPTFRALTSLATPHRTAKIFSLPFAACSGSAASGTSPSFARAKLLERQHNGSLICGIIVRANAFDSFDDLDEYFMDLILRSTHIGIPLQEMTSNYQTNDRIVDEIVDLFDITIRNLTPDDQWTATGRGYFSRRVEHFTRHGMKLEFALPAFPCKSSNPNKVGGNLPDLAEAIALTTLHKFVIDIERLYAPGATVLIVSDGHVFSDCIGVDDDTVDNYGKHLSMMNDALSTAFLDDGRQRVCLRSLPEMLQASWDNLQGPLSAQQLALDSITHHIGQVGINDNAELCRRLLMQGFKANTHKLRSSIASHDPAMLRLYRGFSRFMLEDLENNKYTQHLSKSQRRKLSSKVAFEMIERNQAYSNLVEVVLPNYIRLSIHAHNNAGPKFGINLMGRQVRATNSLPPDGSRPESCDLLHVPTPWHGCIVEVAGHDHLYLAKAEQVRAAVHDNKILAAWVVPKMGSAMIGATRRKNMQVPDKIIEHLSDSGAWPTAAYFIAIPTDMQYRI
ncbi:unnamed protein product [Cercospora beticola]|nr:unnamed protein product [Cercospora beticola]